MNRDKLIKIFEEEYPPVMAWEDDYIGLQLTGKEEINKVLLTLDTTVDVIAQAIQEDVDMIVSHHPIFWGDSQEVLDKDPLLKAAVIMLVEKKINIFVAHTNADFAPSSLAFNQALAINLDNPMVINNNEAVAGLFEDEKQLSEVIDSVRTNMNLDYSFRTNEELTTGIKNVVIASGAAGDLITNPELIGKLFIVGEMKHHNWVDADKLGIKVLEIGHFSETIFKDMAEALLLDEEIEVIQAKETNGYKSV